MMRRGAADWTTLAILVRHGPSVKVGMFVQLNNQIESLVSTSMHVLRTYSPLETPNPAFRS
jgi:hypothetical protein